MARVTSAPDNELAAQLRQRGMPAQPRQFERLRAAGLLETRHQRGQGQGRGSVASASKDETDRAADAIALLDRHGSYVRAGLAMFGSGRYAMAKDRLERLFDRRLEELGRDLPSAPLAPADQRDAVFEIAGRLAARVAKDKRFATVRRRLRELPEVGVRDGLERAAVDLLSIVTHGVADSNFGLFELLTTIGATEIDPNLRQEAPTFRAVRDALAECSADRMRKTVHWHRQEDLDRARNFLLDVRRGANIVADGLARTQGWQAAFPWWLIATATDPMIAFATPATAWLLRTYPRETRALEAQLDALNARWIATGVR